MIQLGCVIKLEQFYSRCRAMQRRLRGFLPKKTILHNLCGIKVTVKLL